MSEYRLQETEISTCENCAFLSNDRRCRINIELISTIGNCIQKDTETGKYSKFFIFKALAENNDGI